MQPVAVRGIFEIMQDNTTPGNLIFNTLDPPYQADAVWQAYFLILLVAGNNAG